MNHISLFPLLGEAVNSVLPVAIAAFGMVLVSFIFLAIWAIRYRKVGPDEVLVVSGRRHVYLDNAGNPQVTGFRMVKGGGTFVVPVVETAKVLSLKPLFIDLAFSKIPARGCGSVDVRSKAQIRIRSDDLSLARAAESLLGKSPEEIKELAGQLLESSLRNLIGERTAEDIAQTQGSLAAQWHAAAAPTLADLGLELLSLSTREVTVSESARP